MSSSAAPDAIKAMYLVDGGEKKELNRHGYSGSNDDYTYSYTSDSAFPPKGHLVVEVRGNRLSFEATFKLEDLPLLGEPARTK